MTLEQGRPGSFVSSRNVSNYIEKTSIFHTLADFDGNRRKLGITPKPISGLPRYNTYSLNLQRRETEDSIRVFPI